MPKPRIGVLMCGHVPVDLQEISGGDYDLVYRNLVESADPNIDLAVYPVIDDAFPESIDECDGWIITGSPYDADSDEAWVVKLRDWITEASAARARIAGVCFGHQLVAEALGGKVGRADRWKVGPQDTEVQPTSWFEGGEVKLNAMHQDVVTQLPPGARLIAEGSTSEFPAYLVGNHIVCVQDHPELDADYVGALLDLRVARIDADTASAARRRLASEPTDGRTVGRWLVDFLLDRRLAT